DSDILNKKIPFDVLKKKSQNISRYLFRDCILSDELFSKPAFNNIFDEDEHAFSQSITQE
ncbi:hypothetical protein OFC38_30430, partial [Escherichia coli]|nr:hypothetical protein [Escherichia coli]